MTAKAAALGARLRRCREKAEISMRIQQSRQPYESLLSSHLWTFRWLAGRFFLKLLFHRMDLDGTVERNCFYFEVNQLLFLKAFEYAVRNSVFAPTVHPGVNTVSKNAKSFRQIVPLTSMFRRIQD
jgi:hypothetical protein